MMTAMRLPRVLCTVALSGLLLSGCGSGAAGGTTTITGGGTSTPDPATRPSSPAVLTIVAPTQSQVVTGTMVHVVVSLDNAHVVAQTSTNITPDTGHVHLYLDSQLIYMQYRLEQDVPVHAGVYSLRAEFVAADHFPFSPRVWSQTILFTVS